MLVLHTPSLPSFAPGPPSELSTVVKLYCGVPGLLVIVVVVLVVFVVVVVLVALW